MSERLSRAVAWALDKKPYVATCCPKGPWVAKHPLAPDQKNWIINTFYGTLASDFGVDTMWPILKQWILPVMEENQSVLCRLDTSPRQVLPAIFDFSRRHYPILIISTNCQLPLHPDSQNKVFTTQTLFSRGQGQDYHLQSWQDPNNHFICVPTALRATNLISEAYYRSWIEAINQQGFVPIDRWETNSHMMAVTSVNPRRETITISDQYGHLTVNAQILINMFRFRQQNSLPEYRYPLKIVVPRDQVPYL